ncbi:hypothetical protein TCAL_16004, partial [Tigriopus californicus]
SGKSDGWNYFVNNYGPNGKVCKPKEWARCFNHGILSHNLIEESFEERKAAVLQRLNNQLNILTPVAAEILLKKVQDALQTSGPLFPKLDRGQKRERIQSIFPRTSNKRKKIPPTCTGIPPKRFDFRMLHLLSRQQLLDVLYIFEYRNCITVSQ